MCLSGAQTSRTFHRCPLTPPPSSNPQPRTSTTTPTQRDRAAGVGSSLTTHTLKSDADTATAPFLSVKRLHTVCRDSVSVLCHALSSCSCTLYGSQCLLNKNRKERGGVNPTAQVVAPPLFLGSHLSNTEARRTPSHTFKRGGTQVHSRAISGNRPEIRFKILKEIKIS